MFPCEDWLQTDPGKERAKRTRRTGRNHCRPSAENQTGATELCTNAVARFASTTDSRGSVAQVRRSE